MPVALSIGMTEALFWDSNPRKLKAYMKAYEYKQKQSDRDAWLNGIYVLQAVGSLFDKNSHYPDSPISDKQDNTLVITDTMTEADKEREQMKLLANLQLMQSNFELNHGQ